MSAWKVVVDSFPIMFSDSILYESSVKMPYLPIMICIIDIVRDDKLSSALDRTVVATDDRGSESVAVCQVSLASLIISIQELLFLFQPSVVTFGSLTVELIRKYGGFVV